MVSALLYLVFAQANQLPVLPKICIDKIRGEVGLASSAEDAITAALLSSKRFRLVEVCEKAEYIVRGSIVERADLKSRSEGEETGVAAAGISSNRNYASGSAMGARGSESLSTTETKRAITLSVKFVNKDGEVVFAATQDSAPSKNRSAMSEAADRLSRDVIRELFAASPSKSDQKSQSGYQKIK